MARIVILGAGESGAGAAVLAQKKGFDTFVSDMSLMLSFSMTGWVQPFFLPVGQ